MALQHVITSSSSVESLVKPDSSYQWFTYTGKPLDMVSGGGTILYLKKGRVFGVRKSASGKKIRMITEDLGGSKVFTLLPEMALHLANHCTPTEVVTATQTGDAPVWVAVPSDVGSGSRVFVPGTNIEPGGYRGVYAYCLSPFAVVTESENSEYLMVTTRKKNFDPDSSSQILAGKFTDLKSFNSRCAELGLPNVTAAFYRKAFSRD